MYGGQINEKNKKVKQEKKRASLILINGQSETDKETESNGRKYADA